MRAELFLDTNVLVYAFDRESPEKQKRARGILAGSGDGEWIISWQVIQEFTSVALHRFAEPMRTDELGHLLRILLWPACEVLPSEGLYRQALSLQVETQYRYYDCLILAAAIASGAKSLYSEDLQHGRSVGGVKIINPFQP